MLAPSAVSDATEPAAALGMATQPEHAAAGAAELELAVSPRRAEGLTESDVGNLNAILEHEIARNTRKNYCIQWKIFGSWATRKGVPALPADAAQVAAYLAERLERHGHKPATLRVAASAIAFVHRSAGLDDPCARPEVKRTLRGAARKAGRSQKQADALTAEALALISSTARRPRPGRGGWLESPQTALSRGNLDIALISLMRDAMLRISEAAALSWNDLGAEPDGTGRLLIRRSKTDPEGLGAVAFVSAPTMAALGLIRDGAPGGASMFGVSPNQISRRIKRAAQTAGLGDGFSGHSPRVGMARDLVRAGAEMSSLMIAGRWRTSTMPAHYARNETAGRGAVAEYYRARRPPEWTSSARQLSAPSNPSDERPSRSRPERARAPDGNALGSCAGIDCCQLRLDLR